MNKKVEDIVALLIIVLGISFALSAICKIKTFTDFLWIFGGAIIAMLIQFINHYYFKKSE